MRCSRCQQDAPSDAEFCPECGTKLAAVCAQCGTVNASGHKFCKKCGQPLTSAVEARPAGGQFGSPESYTPKHLAEKILTSRAALEGERKQVTVLFADLKGSMEMLADRDPEEARKLLDPVLELMMEAVHRYEGTVNQVMGDGIMALFGAPLAHEDHAVRACYAALRMQQTVNKYAAKVRRSHAAVVKIRVGLNSGEVVVRAIGSDLHMDYTAVGQTTHLAARMEQIADPGAIVITPETLALAEGYVEVKSLGPVSVKGLADAMEVYEVTGAGPARTRLQAATRRGLTRFVGRDAEVEQLRRALQLAGSGRGQVVIAALPESPSTLEQGFEIRLELGTVLVRLGEARRRLEHMHEAETLAERLNDDRRRGRVYVTLINAHALRGELDEALVAGTRALEIAARLGDLRLRILATTYLAQAHQFRGDFERAVELATESLGALPADWVYEPFGNSPVSMSVFIRLWVVHGLAELGRFAEAAPHEAELLRLAGPSQHAYTVDEAHNATGMLHLRKGDWATARSEIELSIAAYRTGNIAVVLPVMVAASAWVLAQVGEASEALTRLRESEQLLERQAARGAVLTNYQALGRAALLLNRLDEAQSLGDRAVTYSQSRHHGAAANALHLLGDVATHPDRFDAERGEAYYRKALALAEPRGMRPLIAHCHLGLSKLYRRTGKQQQAQEHLSTATAMYREMDMRSWLEKADAEMRALAA